MIDAKSKVIEYLAEAHGKETALIQTLTVHLRVAEGSYKQLLERHREETIEHAKLVQNRMKELGGHKNVLAVGAVVAQNLLTNSLAMAKGPVDMIRGKSVSEKQLRNARDEAATEALEIACYDSLERLATKVGDDKTAELARRIRRDEEAMLQALRKEIPTLTDAVVGDQVGGGAPWPGYDDMTAADISKRLTDAPAAVKEQVAQYERLGKNRSSVLRAAERQSTS